MWGVVEAPSGHRLAALEWGDPERERVGDRTATPEQLAALRRVDTLLTDPVSVLPSSAWAVQKVRAYVPSHYAVCINTSPPKDASQLLPLLPTRAANVLRDKSLTPSEGDVQASPDGGGPVEVQGRWVEYCAKLRTEEAREVVDALPGHDKESGYYETSITLRYRLTEGAHWWEGAGIRVEPYFPDGTFVHSDAG
jgi:hypothetical protein